MKHLKNRWQNIKRRRVKADTEMKADDWKDFNRDIQAVVKDTKGFDFPQDPIEQLGSGDGSSI